MYRPFNFLLSACLFAACSTDFKEDTNPNSSVTQSKVSLDSLPDIDLHSLSKALFDNQTIIAQPKEPSKRRMFKDKALSIRDYMAPLNAEVIEVPVGVDPIEMIEELRNSGEYTYVEPNFKVKLSTDFSEMGEEVETTGTLQSTDGNDPLAGFQWNLSTIGMDALPADVTGQGITVAVIDTGVATGGQDAPVNVLAGYDFINNDADAHDDNGHGTHVAGTIAQATNNNIGVSGVSPDVNILPIKALSASGSGSYAAIANSIVYAVDNGADVINMSLGGPVSASILADAVEYAYQNDVVVVAATGNDGSDTAISYPAAYETVVAVGSVGYLENRSYYSNAGSAIDFVAPGGDMRFDDNGDGYADGILQETLIGSAYGYYFFQGTSMASPHVAAAYALLLGEGATAEEADQALRATTVDLGTDGWDSQYGQGLIKVDDAHAYYLASRPVEPEEQPLDAMMLRATDSRVQVRVWPSSDVVLNICLQSQDGTEKCRQRAPHQKNHFGGGQLGINNNDNYNSITVGVIQADGSSYTYGPYDIPNADSLWSDVVTCDSDVEVDVTDVRLRSAWGQHGKVQFRFSSTDSVAIVMDGLNSSGVARTKWRTREAGTNVYGFGIEQGQQEFAFQVRDAYGCSVDYGGYSVPETNQWQVVE